MHLQGLVSQEVLLHQIANQAGIVHLEHRELLKKSFEKKYAHHINRIQYHRLRQSRFVDSQRKVFDLQNRSIEQTKQHLAMKQSKANYLKNHSILQRSKRIESDLNKWQKRVEKNKKQQEQRIQQSLKLIQKWDDKISDPSTCQENPVTTIAQTKSRRNNHRSIDHGMSQLPTCRKMNPEGEKQVQERYQRELKKKKSSKNLRVSTESIYDRKQKQEEDLFEDAILKTGQKAERINEARLIKHYILQRKKKLTIEKEQNRKKLQQQHLSTIKSDLEERNRELDKKLKNDKIKVSKKRSSLPLISGSKATQVFMEYGPGQEWRKRNKSNELSPHNKHVFSDKDPESIETSRALAPNYDRLVRQKLRGVSSLVRKA